VNSSSTFRWFIAGALLLTIGWKIAIQPDDPNYLKENLVKFFERNHFTVVVTKEIVNYTPIIRASTASCQLQVARLTPDGSNRDLIRHLAAGTDRSFVVFRGTVYTQQPVVWTVLHYLWSRFLRELGLIDHITPVISVAATSSCNAEGLPWDELEAIGAHAASHDLRRHQIASVLILACAISRTCFGLAITTRSTCGARTSTTAAALPVASTIT
jgi:hypothetical protein